MKSPRNSGGMRHSKLKVDLPICADTVTSVTRPAEAAPNSLAGWREPPVLTLDANGMIVSCSERGEAFFGYARKELEHQHVSRVLPELADQKLLQNGEPNARFSFLCHIGHAFEVRPRAGTGFLCGLSLVCLTGAGQTILRLIANSPPAMLGERTS